MLTPSPLLTCTCIPNRMSKHRTREGTQRKYVGEGGPPRDPRALADYYRSRKIAFVVFAVDERLTGRRRVTNEEVVKFAADNRDIAIPFASIDPHRRQEGVGEAKRLVSAGAVRGLKLHPPVQQFFPDATLAHPRYSLFGAAGV